MIVLSSENYIILHTTRHELDDVTPDTRVILVQLWSDGFEAHKVKAKNNLNNLQLFTLTVLADQARAAEVTLLHGLYFIRRRTTMKYLSKYWVRSILFKHLDGDTRGQKKNQSKQWFSWK